MNWYGLLVIAALCLIIILIALILLGCRKNILDDIYEAYVHSDRNVGYITGASSLTATYVSTVFVSYVVGMVYSKGFLHTQMSWGYVVSLVIGGCLFARKFQDAEYSTILDPLQDKYGKYMAAVLYLPITLAELFWIATIISSLKSSLRVEYGDYSRYIALVVVLLTMMYLVMGGFHAIVHVNSAHFVLLFAALWIIVPYLLLSDLEQRIITNTTNDWVGTIDADEIGLWLDMLLVTCLGGISWPMYFLHIASCISPTHGQVVTFSAAIGCLICMVPLTFVGAVAKLQDWNTINNSTNLSMHPAQDISFLLPLTIEYLTPTWVYFLGYLIVVLSAMSSIDSLTFSSSVMFSSNIYKLCRVKASPRERIWVTRIAAFIIVSVSTALGVTINNVHEYWILMLELLYILIFPHFLAAIFIKSANVYGSVAAVFIGLLLRLCAGVKELGIPHIVKYPFYNSDKNIQIFPFRTITMFVTFLILLLVSFVANRFMERYKTVVTQDEIDIIRISYREPQVERVTSFSKIGSGSYNNITASANDIRNSRYDEQALLKSALSKTYSNNTSKHSEHSKTGSFYEG